MIDYKLKARALAAELKRVTRALDASTLREAEFRAQVLTYQKYQITTRAVLGGALGWDPARPLIREDLEVVLKTAAAVVDTRGPSGCDLCDAPTIHNLRRAILAGRKK